MLWLHRTHAEDKNRKHVIAAQAIRSDGKMVAIKVTFLVTEEWYNETMRAELEILKLFRGKDHVIQLLGFQVISQTHITPLITGFRACSDL